MLIPDKIKHRYCTCMRCKTPEGTKCLRCGKVIKNEGYATCSGFITDGYLCRDCHDRLDDCVPPETKRKYLTRKP